MIGKTTITAAVLGTVLTLVPTALAKHQPASTVGPEAIERAVLAREQSQRRGVVSDAFERAVALSRPSSGSGIGDRSEALNQHYGLGAYAAQTDAFERSGQVAVTPTYPDALERATLAGRPIVSIAGGQVGDSHDRIGPVPSSTPVSVTSSGLEIEWPQIGVGFVLGALLVAVLWLPLRTARSRPLAH
jgi:hypothetical protein